MKDKIIVKPLAGLTNRLRALESAYSLAKMLDKPLEVVWITDGQMVAQFDEIFVLPDSFKLLGNNAYKYAHSSFSLKGIKGSLSKVVNAYYGIDAAFSELDIPLIWSKKIDLPEFCRDRTCYFFTCQKFFSSDSKYSWLKPVPAVQTKIDMFEKSTAGRNCIGIHIRRTDHAVSIAESPDMLFEKAIDNEISKNENAVFFLATDNSATEQKFVSKYGKDRIITNPKRFGRDSLEATQDAAVDLLSLSKCTKLYCSYWSSFSETAADISGAETIICRNQSV